MSDPLRQFFPNLPVNSNPNQMPPPYMMGPPAGMPPFQFPQLAGHVSPMRMASPPPHMIPQQPPMQDARSLENLLKQQLGVDTSNAPTTTQTAPAPTYAQSPQAQPQHQSNISSSTLARSDSKSSPRRKRNVPESGLLLSGSVVTYTPGQAHSTNNLESTPITLLQSPVVYQLGNMIAVNNNYICYIVKGTIIRVINLYSAQRTLIKGHTDQITDMRFFSKDVDVLASVGKDGNIFLWKILESKQDEQPQVVTLLNIKPKDTPVPQTRLVWHPSTQIFATIGEDNAAYLWAVEALASRAEDSVVFFPQESFEPGVRKINRTSKINNFTFSPDGNHLALAEENGTVSIWDVSDTDKEPLLLHSWQPHESNPVSSVLYCPFAVQDAEKEHFSYVVITGANNNSELRLWDPKTWDCVQTLRFLSSATTTEFYNHVVLEPPFVFVANSKSSSLYVLHLDLPIPNSEDASQEEGTEAPGAESCNFDYITEFDQATPVLSLNVLDRPTSIANPQLRKGLYCVQPRAIQMYHVKPELCYPASVEKKRRKARRELASSRSAPVRSSEPASPKPDQEPEKRPQHAEAQEQDGKQETQEGTDVDNKEEAQQETKGESEGEPEKFQEQESREEQQEKENEQAKLEPSGDEEKPAQTTEEAPSETTHAEEETSDKPAKEPDSSEAPSAMEHEPVGDSSQEVKPEKEPQEEKPEPPTVEDHDGTVSEPEPPKEENAVAQQLGEDGQEAPATQPAQPVGVIAAPVDGEDKTQAQGTPPPLENEAIAKIQPTPKSTRSPSKANLKGKNKKNKKNNSATFVKVSRDTQVDAAPAVFTPLTQPTEQPQAPQVSGNGKVRAVPSVTETGGKDMRKEFKNLENSLSSRLEKALLQHVDRQFARIEKERVEKEKAEREQQQRLLSAISQTINVTVASNVEKIIQRELQGNVVPAVQKLLVNSEKNFAKSVQEELKKYVVSAMGNRLSALEASIKESVSAQLASSIHMEGGKGAVPNVDVLTEKVVAAIRQPVQESFREYFKDILVPSFEASCQKMFQQISHNFEDGIQQTFESVSQRSRELHAEAGRGSTSDAEAALLGQLGNAVHTLVDISANLNNSIISTQAHLIQQLSQVDKREKEKEAEYSVTRDPKSEIESLRSQGRFEQAFNLALSERDLSLVTWLCSKFEPRGFFLINRGALTQVTMLSLLQQLGFDFSRDVQLKLAWLTEIATLLNPRDETLQGYATGILEHLHANLQGLFMQLERESNLDSAQSASMCRVLTMIVQSLLETARGSASSTPNTLSLSSSSSSIPQQPYASPYRC